MGTWSTESFGNDGAMDWFTELQSAIDPLAFIQQTIASRGNEQVIAAAEALAALNGKFGAAVYPDLLSWSTGKTAPNQDLLGAMSEAIQEILDDPEADVHDNWAELGEDDEDYIAWLATLRDIQMRLQRADS